MRAFIGIDFTNELKDEISKLQNILRPLASSGRWKYRDNFHLTLKFLGDIDENAVKCIDEELRSITGQKAGFKLRISEVGKFPGRENIRVLWLGVDGDMRNLFDLQREIETRMQTCGFESEKRRYSPHVTIAQDVVFNRNFEEIRGLFGGIRFTEIIADRICLFKSEQIGNKRVYTPVREYLLKNR
ncbi:MAG: RNA 2',3'-cyclic phosphodiesterase [Clostridia bacterium]|nr:RNA 2',3'-cyclic phosphodiesterase [Clostridia bacterium]